MNFLREWFIDCLIAWAKRTPYYHIYSGGELYMERWWLVKPRRWLPFSVRVHRILRSDKDICLHDHPFPFITWIMRGEYFEEVPALQRQHPKHDGCRRNFHLRIAGDVMRHEATDRHRLHITGTETWTLFVMGRRQQSWGFYTPTGKVHWRDYLGDYTTKTVDDDA